MNTSSCFMLQKPEIHLSRNVPAWYADFTFFIFSFQEDQKTMKAKMREKVKQYDNCFKCFRFSCAIV